MPKEEPADRPRSEEELLDRESQLSRGALQRLREEIMQSLRHSADVRAWAARYPWPTLGAAAAAGIAGGWALGSATRHKSPEEQTADDAGEHELGDSPESASGEHPAARLVGGLGTFAGAFASAAIGAATQAIGEAVKELIHDSLHPDTGEQESETEDSSAAE